MTALFSDRRCGTLVVGSVAIVAFLFVFAAAPAAATASSLDEMDGSGTEDDPYVITDADELRAMSEDLSAHYVLGNDIDASETDGWNAGAGFDPIGSPDGPSFDGSLDGRGHTIDGLTVNRPGTEGVGLFGQSAGTVENLHLEGVDVRGGEGWVAGLAGSNLGTIRDVTVTGDVSGNEWGVGGLVGANEGTIERSSVRVHVEGEYDTGGLVGTQWGGTVRHSAAGGTVEASTAGGLIGTMTDRDRASVVYSTADVRAPNAGGLVGTNGGHGNDGGTVSVGFAAGELRTDGGGPIVHSVREPVFADLFWDRHATDMTDGYGTGLTTAEMTGAAAERNMAVLDFENVWTVTDEYPVFERQIEDVSLSLSDSTVGQGERTSATVTLALEDGSTATASAVADYESGGIASADGGVVDARQQGTTEITATVAGESDTAELEITEPPRIELEDVELDAAAVTEGTAVTATATYANDGGPGSHTAELIADGETVATERISLATDDEATVEFEWTPDGAAGASYDVAVDDTDAGSVDVVEPGTVALESASFPERVGTGSPFEFTVELTNEADETVAETVSYDLEDETVLAEPIAVPADGATAVLGGETETDPGLTVVHAVTVDGETIEDTSHVAEPPAFEITDVDAPDEVATDEAFEVTVTVENDGGVAGSQRVTLGHDGTERAGEELTVDADGSETVSFSLSEAEAADYEYTVAVDEDETSAAVTAVAADDADGSDSDGLPGFGAVVALAALSLVTLLARGRR